MIAQKDNNPGKVAAVGIGGTVANAGKSAALAILMLAGSAALMPAYAVLMPTSGALVLQSFDSGDPIPGTIGGYTMTKFDLIGSTSGSSLQVLAPGGGFVEFSHAMNNNTANSTTTNGSTSSPSNWWTNGETDDYDIYTTNQSLIHLTLPVDTLAFSFSVGADLGTFRDNAWLLATATEGPGIDEKHWFNVRRNHTPGFAVYADNRGGDCSTISTISIDPDYWGTGNFSISRGSCDVPEPSVLALFAAGLFGLGLARRRINPA